MNSPSRTSQAVALVRAGLDRPHSAEGDPDAQRALCAQMRFAPPTWLGPSVAARTRFVDEQVTAAIAGGIRQVVVCGAGYDDRALRFRTAGVRFFELDHPATQSDKARLLRGMGTGGGPEVTGPAESGPAVQGLTLVEADFRSDDVAELLERAGHDSSQPSLFVCEGLLVYLDADTCHWLLTSLASRAAAGSVLVATLATHADGFDSAEVVAAANSRRRTGDAEPWQTILPPDQHLALLEQAGWTVTTTQWSPVTSPEVSYGRRSLLVLAGAARV